MTVPDSEETRVLSDATVIVAYLVMISAALVHLFVLVPRLEFLREHYYLALGATVLLLAVGIYGTARQIYWATTWG